MAFVEGGDLGVEGDAENQRGDSYGKCGGDGAGARITGHGGCIIPAETTTEKESRRNFLLPMRLRDYGQGHTVMKATLSRSQRKTPPFIGRGGIGGTGGKLGMSDTGSRETSEKVAENHCSGTCRARARV